MIARMNQGAALADGLFGDAADVIGGRCQVAQHDGRRPPERNERQHHGGGDDHLHGPRPLFQCHGIISSSTMR